MQREEHNQAERDYDQYEPLYVQPGCILSIEETGFKTSK